MNQDEFAHHHLALAKRLVGKHVRAARPHERLDVESDVWFGFAIAATRWNPDLDEPGSDGGAYVVMIIANHVIDGFRTRNARHAGEKRDLLQARSLDEPLNDDGLTLGDLLPDRHDFVEKLADEEIERAGVAGLLALVDRLQGREREVVRATYLDGVSLREVGERWGVTESRAAQVRSAAVARMRWWLGLGEVRTAIPHGTARGFQQHQRQKTTPCEPCRLARNADQQEYQRRTYQKL